MSLAPPGGNALKIVIAREGKVSCARAGPAAARAAVPITKLRRSMIVLRNSAKTSAVSSLHATDCLHSGLDPLGVLVPEFRKFRLIEESHHNADIFHGVL